MSDLFANSSPEDTLVIRETLLTDLDRREKVYDSYLRAASRRQKMGRLAIIAPLVAAGVLMAKSSTERQETSVRISTDMVAVVFAALGGVMGEARADEQKKRARDEATRALPVISTLGIDAPSWVQEGVRIRQFFEVRDAA